MIKFCMHIEKIKIGKQFFAVIRNVSVLEIMMIF